jgi:hypothetical protein
MASNPTLVIPRESRDWEWWMRTYRIAERLWYIADRIQPAVIILGTLMNIMTIVVLARGKVGKPSTRILLIALSLADLSVIFVQYLSETINMHLGFSSIHKNDYTCKLAHLFMQFFPFFSHWNVMLLTIERWISVSLPLKARYLCNKQNISLSLLATFLLTFGLSLPKAFVFHIADHGYCVTNIKHKYFYYNIYLPVIVPLFSFSIPYFGIIICNILILFNVRRSQRMRRKLRQPGGAPDANAAQLNDMTRMLVTVSVVFLLLVFPHSAQNFVFEKIIVLIDEFWASVVFHVLSPITVQLVLINHSSNFILYCLSGKQFRREFLKIIRWNRIKCTHSRS